MANDGHGSSKLSNPPTAIDGVSSNALMAKVAKMVTEITQWDKVGHGKATHKGNSAYDQALSNFECDRINVVRESLMEYANVTIGSQLEPTPNLNAQFDRLVNANDVFHERIATCMEYTSGERVKQMRRLLLGEKQAPSTRAQWNKPVSVGESQLQEQRTHVRRLVHVEGKEKIIQPSPVAHPRAAIVRPQTMFKDCIDNSKKPFRPKLVTKHNAQVPWPRVTVHSDSPSQWLSDAADDCSPEAALYEHPYKHELSNFVPLENLFTSCVSLEPTESTGETPLTMISTVEELKNLCELLQKETEFAVDLEANAERSYQGLVCLVQISTRSDDYIIDPFPLWRHMHLLNEPFTNPNIVKVFHGAHNDILWLQRDFGIYVVNMFDTYQALCVLDRRPRSLAHLVSSYARVVLDKSYALADWRIRPLPDELVKYARDDTHYLLYCYDRLRNDLLAMGKELLRLVFHRSCEVCLSTYTKSVATEGDADALCRRLMVRFNHRQQQAFRWLFLWRDEVARVHDESVQYVLPDRLMVKLAELLPGEPVNILIVASPVPPLLKLHVVAVSRILNNARNLPELQPKPDRLSGDDSDDYTRWEAEVARPHDFSHVSMTEELLGEEIHRTIESCSASSLNCSNTSAFSFDQKKKRRDIGYATEGEKEFVRWQSPYSVYADAIAVTAPEKSTNREPAETCSSDAATAEKEEGKNYPEVIRLKLPPKQEASKHQENVEDSSSGEAHPLPKDRPRNRTWVKKEINYVPYDYTRSKSGVNSEYRWINPVLNANGNGTVEDKRRLAAKKPGTVGLNRNGAKPPSRNIANAKELSSPWAKPGRKKKVTDGRTVTYVPKA